MGCTLELWNVRGGWTLHPPRICRRDLEGELQSELHHAAASRADQRIAGRDIGCRAPAAEPTWAARVVTHTPATPADHRAVRIGEIGVIEHVKELGAELGAQ